MAKGDFARAVSPSYNPPEERDFLAEFSGGSDASVNQEPPAERDFLSEVDQGGGREDFLSPVGFPTSIKQVRERRAFNQRFLPKKEEEERDFLKEAGDPTFGEAIAQGLQEGSSGILLGMGASLKEMQNRATKELPFFKSIAKKGATFASDGPAIAAGLLFGSPGGPVVAGASGFATPALIRQGYREFLEVTSSDPRFKDKTFREVIGNIGKSGAKEGAIGALLALNPLMTAISKVPGGKALLNSTAKNVATTLATELTTLTSASALINKEKPSLRSIAEDAVLLGGFKTIHAGTDLIVNKSKSSGKSPEFIVDEVARSSLDNKPTMDDLKAVSAVQEHLVERLSQEKNLNSRLVNEIESFRNRSKLTPEESQRFVTKEVLRRASDRRLGELNNEYSKATSESISEAEPTGLKGRALLDNREGNVVQNTPAEKIFLDQIDVKNQQETGLFNQNVGGALDSFFSKFDVERPFKELGFPELGFKVKNYHGKIAEWDTRALDLVQDLNKFSPEERGVLALLAEKDTLPTDPRFTEAYKKIRGFFDEGFGQLKEAGVLRKPFPEGYIERLRAENTVLSDRTKREKGKNRSDILKQINENNKAISKLERTEFVHIPTREWFGDTFTNDPGMGKRMVKFLSQKKRKTITIQDMIDDGAIKAEDVDINNILARYARRASRDIALGEIVKEARIAGLVSSTSKEGFVKYPGYMYPALAAEHIHPVFGQWLQSYVEPKPWNLWDDTARFGKTTAFYNPVIMPSNNLLQQAWLVASKPLTRMKNLPGAYKDGIGAYRTRNKHFWDAYQNGAFSTPNVLPYETTFKRLLKTNKDGASRTATELLRQLPKEGLDIFNDTVQGIAWGADQAQRMVDYMLLLEEGKSPRDAAQLTARYHGDYARIPPKTRRNLNRAFLVPTFTISMFRALFEGDASMRSKLGKRVLANSKLEKGQLKLNEPMIGGLALAYGLDQFMNGIGFETDRFGIQYSKRVENDEGLEKDVVYKFNLPFLKTFKIAGTVADSFSPGNETPLLSFIEKNKFQLSRPIAIAHSLVMNNDRGMRIIDPVSSRPQQMVDTSSFLLKETFKILTEFQAKPSKGKKDRELLDREMGKLFNYLPFSYGWVQDPKERKVLFEAKRILDNRRKDIRKRIFRTGEPVSDKKLGKDIANDVKAIEALLEKGN